MKNRFIFVIIFLLFSTQLVLAASFKKYAGEFLYLGAGGRAVAMAGAYSALSNDVTSIYWNPAGLMETKGLEVHFMHSKQFISSIQQNYLAASTPLQNDAVIGAALYYLTISDNPDSRKAYNEVEQKVDYSKVTRFNIGDYVFSLAYSKNYSENINWGVSVKFIYRDYEIENATGIGFDAGLKYTLDNLRLGFVLRDFTSTLIAWSTNEKELVTPSARLGAAYTFTFKDYNLDITPAVDVNILAESRDYAAQVSFGPFSADFLSGLEINYDNTLALRVGIDDLQRLNTGVGLTLPKITFDYAFTSYSSELGNIHRISFHLNLGNVFN